MTTISNELLTLLLVLASLGAMCIIAVVSILVVAARSEVMTGETRCPECGRDDMEVLG